MNNRFHKGFIFKFNISVIFLSLFLNVGLGNSTENDSILERVPQEIQDKLPRLKFFDVEVIDLVISKIHELEAQGLNDG
jgi:hypothetical protein